MTSCAQSFASLAWLNVYVLWCRYYKHWLHTSQQIQVKSADGSSTSATIQGVDPSDATLVAIDDATGQELHLWPSDSTFDMMAGMIRPK